MLFKIWADDFGWLHGNPVSPRQLRAVAKRCFDYRPGDSLYFAQCEDIDAELADIIPAPKLRDLKAGWPVVVRLHPDTVDAMCGAE